MPPDPSAGIELVQANRLRNGSGIADTDSRAALPAVTLKADCYKPLAAPALPGFSNGSSSIEGPDATSPFRTATVGQSLVKWFTNLSMALKLVFRCISPTLPTVTDVKPLVAHSIPVPVPLHPGEGTAHSSPSILDIVSNVTPVLVAPAAAALAQPNAPQLLIPSNVHVINVHSKTGYKLSVEIQVDFCNYHPYRGGCCSATVLLCSREYPNGIRERTTTGRFKLDGETSKSAFDFDEYSTGTVEAIGSPDTNDVSDLTVYISAIRNMLQKVMVSLPHPDFWVCKNTEADESIGSENAEEEEKEDATLKQQQVKSQNILIKTTPEQNPLFDEVQTRLNTLRSTLYFELPYHRAIREKQEQAAEGSDLPITFENLVPPEEAVRMHVEKIETSANMEFNLRRLDNQVLQDRFMEAYKEYSVKGLGHIEIAFHGTNLDWVASIEKNGLIIPGHINPSTGEQLEPRTDNGHSGKGVYLSPQMSYSQCYSYGNSTGLGSIFVCLVLCGRYYDCTVIQEGRALERGYDSHRGCEGCEWVFFDTRAVLPIYLMEDKPSM